MDDRRAVVKIVCNCRRATLSKEDRPFGRSYANRGLPMPENHPAAVADACRTASDHHVPGYGHALLPFPAEPGPFLAEALKALYGVFLRFRCEVAGAELELRGAEAPPPLTGSLGYLLGGGTRDLATRTIGVVA